MGDENTALNVATHFSQSQEINTFLPKVSPRHCVYMAALSRQKSEILQIISLFCRLNTGIPVFFISYFICCPMYLS